MAIIDYNIIRLIKILHILKYIIIIDYDITYLIKMFRVVIIDYNISFDKL